jgi:hypothetical protein
MQIIDTHRVLDIHHVLRRGGKPIVASFHVDDPGFFL